MSIKQRYINQRQRLSTYLDFHPVLSGTLFASRLVFWFLFGLVCLGVTLALFTSDVPLFGVRTLSAPSSSAEPMLVTSAETPYQFKMHRVLDSLEFGQILFNTPTSMKTGHSGMAYASIQFGKIPQEVVEEYSAKPDSTTQIDSLKIAPKMRIVLQSADFEVTPIGSEEQSVGGSDSTNWRWAIYPKRSGVLHLNFTATVVLEGEVRDLKTEDKDITVEVDEWNTAKELLKANLGAIVAILTALCSVWMFFWEIIKRRRKKKTQRKRNKAIHSETNKKRL